MEAVVGIERPSGGHLVDMVVGRESALKEIIGTIDIGHFFSKGKVAVWYGNGDGELFCKEPILGGGVAGGIELSVSKPFHFRICTFAIVVCAEVYFPFANLPIVISVDAVRHLRLVGVVGRGMPFVEKLSVLPYTLVLFYFAPVAPYRAEGRIGESHGMVFADFPVPAKVCKIVDIVIMPMHATVVCPDA